MKLEDKKGEISTRRRGEEQGNYVGGKNVCVLG